jgi:hypothetical protein
MINKEHLAKLIDLGLVEMREDVPYLTVAGRNAVWRGSSMQKFAMLRREAIRRPVELGLRAKK